MKTDNIIQRVVNVRMTLTEEALGTSPSDKEVYDTFIASNAPDAPSRAEEIEAYGVGDVAEKGRTIFERLPDGTPFAWNYQIRGMFKEAAGAFCELTQTVTETDTVTGKTKKKKITRNETGKAGFTKYNHKGRIDKFVFVEPRKVPIVFDGGVGDCQRSLRAETMQGPRVTLASSDTVPAGATLTFQVGLADENYYNSLIEWLDYGKYHGFGQWRNSGKGCYLYEILDDNGNVIGGNMA